MKSSRQFNRPKRHCFQGGDHEQNCIQVFFRHTHGGQFKDYEEIEKNAKFRQNRYVFVELLGGSAS